MKRTRLFISACAGMFLFGVALVLLGTLFGLPAMRTRLELTSLVRQGDLQSLLLAGVLVSTVLVGPLIDRFGHKPVLTVSAALTAFSLAGFAWATGYGTAEALAFALGLGGGGLNMDTNVLVSELYRDDRGAKLNQLGVFFGVGALLMPFVTAWVERSITQLILGTAVLSAAATIAYAYLKFPAAREASGASILESARALKYPGVLVFGLLLFFESGNEAAITGWMTTWASGVGATVRIATLMLALFQGMMMLGRIVAAPVLKKVSNSRMVSMSVAAAIVSMIVLVSAHSLTGMVAAAGLAGLAFAPIYPTVLALAADRYQRYAGTVFGILFTIGLAGGIAYPWAIGHVSETAGVRAGIWFPLGGTVAIALLVTVLQMKYPAGETITADSSPAAADSE